MLSFLPLNELYASVNQSIQRHQTNNTNYDVIVLGVGSMGSAACYYLASKGVSVLGLEQFNLPHENGSHSGQSRIIRKAYFEHPDYVPLLERSYHNWVQIEQESGADLFHKTGLLYFGKSDSELLTGVKKSSEIYNIEVDELDRNNLSNEYPQFEITEDYSCLYEPNAGFVTPERSILAHSELALRKGAEIHLMEKVAKWRKNGDSIEVQTDKTTYQCKKLIISAGAWTKEVIPQLQPKITVTRQTIAWVVPKKWDNFTLGNFPCWTMDDNFNDGIFYGFPILDSSKFGAPIGLKIAHHFQGKEFHPDHVDRTIEASEEEILIQFMNQFMPQGYESTHLMKTCLYVNSSDGNFIIDALPDNKDVIIAAGFSGHGFKFASVIGEILADLAITGKTDLPIDFLKLNRFSK